MERYYVNRHGNLNFFRLVSSSVLLACLALVGCDSNSTQSAINANDREPYIAASFSAALFDGGLDETVENEIKIEDFGSTGDTPLTADLDLDGYDELIVLRTMPDNSAQWIIKDRISGIESTINWGLRDDIPLVGNYNGGNPDLTVWYPVSGDFRSRTDGPCPLHTQRIENGCQVQWGLPGDIPFAADVDSDGYTDYAVWRPPSGEFLMLPSSGACPNQFTTLGVRGCSLQFGLSGDQPMPGFYDNDDLIDPAVWRPSEGRLYLFPTSGECPTFTVALVRGCSYQFGTPSAKFVHGDYDGDGTDDVATWTSNTGVWKIRLSGNQEIIKRQWGNEAFSPLSIQVRGDRSDSRAVWNTISGSWFFTTYPNSVCESPKLFDEQAVSVSHLIETCLETESESQARVLLEIPPGKYTVAGPMPIVHPNIRFTSYGRMPSDERCSLDNNDGSCAEFIAHQSHYSDKGILWVTGGMWGVEIDHIIVDGNKTNRVQSSAAQECASTQPNTNQFGMNIRLPFCEDCKVTNSVSKNALCGTGLEAKGPAALTITNNSFVDNGTHNVDRLWADGLTVLESVGATVKDNYAKNNTDIDIIVGKCLECEVENNTIVHDGGFDKSSFAAMMMASFEQIDADQTGTVVRNNDIDCGAKKGCGFGLYVGGDAWGFGGVTNGKYLNNSITNAQHGIAVDAGTNIELRGNSVQGTGSTTHASCGIRPTTDYSTSGNSSGNGLAGYVEIEWDGCIPNYREQPQSSFDYEVGGITATLRKPSGFVPAERITLVVALHSRAGSGAAMEGYTQSLWSRFRALVLYPDGKKDMDGVRSWNADLACCFMGSTPSTPDDSGDLQRLIDIVKSDYLIERVVVIGASNGAFMAHRLACDASDAISAIVSIAGVISPSMCNPSSSVSVLQMHYVEDRVIDYDGGVAEGFAQPHIGAQQSINEWVVRNGCSGASDSSNQDSGRILVVTFREGCQQGSQASLWSLTQGGHIFAINNAIEDGIVRFLQGL